VNSTDVDVKALKASGIIQQRDPELFSVRLKVAGGYVVAEQLAGLARLVTDFSSEVHLTTRQGIEIPNVPLDRLDALRANLAAIGFEIGGAGPRVRTIAACPGERCKNGLIPANSLSRELHDLLSDRGMLLPHKFKIAVSGCPNGCTKPWQNDLGIMGVVDLLMDAQECNGCEACVPACPARCLSVDARHAVPAIERKEEACVLCGACADVCPTGALRRGEVGFALIVGGKMGKVPALGRLVFPFVPTWKQVLVLCDRTLDFYARHGEQGERFRVTLDRVGFDTYIAEVGPVPE
jgi:anaerobic sulfite reductase subunit C